MKEVRKKLRLKGNVNWPVRKLFKDERVAEAVMKFLKKNGNRLSGALIGPITNDRNGPRRKTNTAVRDLLADGRCTEAVMAFLDSTSVGMWPKMAN